MLKFDVASRLWLGLCGVVVVGFVYGGDDTGGKRRSSAVGVAVVGDVVGVCGGLAVGFGVVAISAR